MANNGVRHPEHLKVEAVRLRKNGLTHREIARELAIGTGTAHVWTRGVTITPEQKVAIQRRRHQHQWTEEDRAAAKKRLAPYHFARKFSAESMLQKIQDFYKENGRIPLKREFNSWHLYAKAFGSWNKAIRAAGFDSNPILFAKRFIANDGHACDSFSEKVIDDWLFEHKIKHTRNVPYGASRMTADFRVGPDIIIEFFGLAGVQKGYDANIEKKRVLAQELKWQLIELYPADIYPQNKLQKILKEHARTE
ncbi:MAG: hypothetical protein Q8P36_01020 [bacterium]|nr:hypothetical protein [bacterium]